MRDGGPDNGSVSLPILVKQRAKSGHLVNGFDEIRLPLNSIPVDSGRPISFSFQTLAMVRGSTNCQKLNSPGPISGFASHRYAALPMIVGDRAK